MCILLSKENRKFVYKSTPIALIIALGSFQVGYIFSMLSFVFYIVYFEEVTNYSDWLPVFSTLYLFGSGIGSLLTSLFVSLIHSQISKCGRKKTLLLAHLFLIPGLFLMNIKVYPLAIALSCIEGVFTGIISTLSPLMCKFESLSVYEISKVEVRGIIVSFH